MIKEIVLHRFKKFQSERFDLTGHVILAGPNNCGKTTVLQAIAAWALALKTWQRLNDYQRHGGFYTKAPIARQAFSAVPLRSFDLLWTNRAYGGGISIEAWLNNGMRLTMELESNSTEQIYVRPKNNVSPEALMSLKLEVVYVATVGGLSVEEPVYQPDFIETLLGRQKPGDVIRNLLLQASKGDSWEILKGAVTRLFGVELMVPSTPGGQIVCEYRQIGGGTTFEISSAGSGFQQVVMLLACLFTRKGSVILVDEPDAHLHVFLQDTIFAELRKAAGNTNSQLVIATHSEVIFNSAEPEEICVMMGTPRRLATGEDVKKLRQAVSVLQQSDLVAALSTPGILYLEGHTDLNLLAEWANVLNHPLKAYFSQTPFWRGKQHPIRTDGPEIPPREHFEALQLVKAGMTGVWLIDTDGKGRIPVSTQPERAKLNRIAWNRYETESYLVHPVALARFIDRKTGTADGRNAVQRFFATVFEEYAGLGLGEQVGDAFIANPTHPSQIVLRYLAETKARTTIIGGILQEGGVHGMDYTRFNEIAAQMLPEEIHPEVREKLDFIQRAFGL